MVDLLHAQPEHLWYFVGLITSDGCLARDGRHIILTSKDPDFLHQVKQALGLTCRVGRMDYFPDFLRGVIDGDGYIRTWILRACYYAGCAAMPRKFESAWKCVTTPNGVRKYGNVIAGVVELADTQRLNRCGRKRP